MRKFIIDQTGYLRLEVERRLVVEVPDDVTQEQVEQNVEDWIEQKENAGQEQVEWRSGDGQGWCGCDMDEIETSVDDSDPVEAEELPVISLEDVAKAATAERIAV